MFQQPEFVSVCIYGGCCNVLPVHNITPFTPGVTSATHTNAHVHIRMVGDASFLLFLLFCLQLSNTCMFMRKKTDETIMIRSILS